MIIWICKTCGRSIKADQKPNFCYADRTTSIENISDEDSIKMQLFLHGQESDFAGFIFEFPGDIRYHPMSGDPLPAKYNGFTLSEYQDEIVRRVKE